ncbi:MAG: carboxypeptidase regulatory-like domain-containing protein [Chloroflexi bacterium]|nr:carboxypeptidase regulatory-like domain-containing protein [Chloroflexota bacterium]
MKIPSRMEFKMKCAKLLALAVLFLASCAAPETVTPTQTFTSAPSTSTPSAGGTPTRTITPDPAMGSIEGDLSWWMSSTSAALPISGVNLEINGHTGNNSRYTARTDPNGHFKFANVEPADYGFGVYLNLQISERQCDAPEYVYGMDLKWVHYATWLKADIWYDILFSSVDVTVNPGEVVKLGFVLKCP